MSDFNLDDGSWESIMISEDEARRLTYFIREHRSCLRDIRISVSGRIGMGQNVVVECLKHPKESQKDITDYGVW